MTEDFENAQTDLKKKEEDLAKEDTQLSLASLLVRWLKQPWVWAFFMVTFLTGLIVGTFAGIWIALEIFDSIAIGLTTTNLNM